ncbi:hypothetical protein KP509_14G019000 [Ceratopteris richardii]|uniref:Uncharacterized protein n=1 Tax=Ceratopteris richardii TaxID=49495 RepID=A0A8T2T7W5_CERRI|nr:hypothetical protein KP509_14G019000 [Ceratopteris richardii]
MARWHRRLPSMESPYNASASIPSLPSLSLFEVTTSSAHRYSFLSLVGVLVILACALALCTGSRFAEANCKVKNDSGKKVIIVPVEVDITIEVDVGVTVELPPAQQKCYFKNPDTDNKQGPVTLNDGSTYIWKDGAVEGTIDLYLGVYLLGILQLTSRS